MAIELEVSEEYRRRFLDSGAWLGKPFHQYIDDWAAGVPQRQALVSGRARLTYRELADHSRQLAAGLQEMGIGRGDVVSFVLPNLVEFILVHAALSRLGALMNPLHLAFREREISQIVNIAESKAIVTIPSFGGFDFGGMLESLKDELPSVQHYLAVAQTIGQATPEGFTDLSEIVERGGRPANFQDPGVGAEVLISLYFTSGTTGEPKGVLHVHDAPLSNAVHVMRDWATNDPEVIIFQGPFGFAMGACVIYCSIVSGATLVLLETFTPEGYARVVQEERVTYTFGGPVQAQAVMSQGLHERYDFSSLDKYLIGGTTSPPAVIREAAEKLQCTPIALWGMTENYATLRSTLEDTVEVAAHSVGRPAPGNELIVIDADDQELPPGEVGELVHRGANLLVGYHKRPDIFRDSFTSTSRGDGWFRTGDLATKDEAGNVTIASRVKDMINRGGAKIYPAEVEALLGSHPHIAQAAIVAIPDERLGERACLFVVRRGDVALSLEDVTTFLAEQRIAKYKYPERLEIVDAMPMNPANKIDKQVLREQLTKPG